MKIVIPIPPSKNASHVEEAVAKKDELIPAVFAWKRGTKGAYHRVKRAMRVVRRRSEEYEEYLKSLETALAGQKFRKRGGQVIVTATVFFPDRRRDMANVIDVLLDSLEGYCYENDRQVVWLHMRREIDEDDPRVVVTIEGLEPSLFDEPDETADEDLALQVEF